MKELTYKELKEWFETNELPTALEGEHKWYRDVQLHVDNCIATIENELKRHGSNIKRSRLAGAAKKNLLDLYEDLKNKENWEKTPENIGFIKLD